jgi:hypothetical protein
MTDKPDNNNGRRELLGDYGDGSYGGFFIGDTPGALGLMGQSVQDYQREINRKKRGKTSAEVKKDAALRPARYRCGHEGCDSRILVGIRNDGHIKYAVESIKALGWVFNQSSGDFRCRAHRKYLNAVDVLRDQYGRPL